MKRFNIPFAILLVLLCLPMMGCDFWYYTRLSIAVVIGVFGIILGLALLNDDEKSSASVVFALGLVIVFFVYPPDPFDSQQNAEFAAAQKKKKEQKQKEFEASPEGQLQSVKSKIQAVQEKLDKNLLRLAEKYKKESSKLQKDVAKRLRSSGLRSHEELVKNREDHKQLYNYFERLSILEYNINWLHTNIKKAKNSLIDLDQAKWKLEHVIEMSKVASEEDMEAITKAILTANATLDKQIPIPQQQDLAVIQQKLFQNLK